MQCSSCRAPSAYPYIRIGLFARLRVIDPLFFLWTHKFQLKLTITRPLGRACIHNGVKISHGKSLTMSIFVHQIPKYRVTCSKLAGELAIAPNYSQLSVICPKNLLKRVLSHHRHDIHKLMTQCLQGTTPVDLICKMTLGVEPLKTEMDPLTLIFYTFKGVQKTPFLWCPGYPCFTAAPTCSSHSGTVLYETYLADQRNLDVYTLTPWFSADNLYSKNQIWKLV